MFLLVFHELFVLVSIKRRVLCLVQMFCICWWGNTEKTFTNNVWHFIQHFILQFFSIVYTQVLVWDTMSTTCISHTTLNQFCWTHSWFYLEPEMVPYPTSYLYEAMESFLVLNRTISFKSEFSRTGTKNKWFYRTIFGVHFGVFFCKRFYWPSMEPQGSI